MNRGTKTTSKEQARIGKRVGDGIYSFKKENMPVFISLKIIN